MSHWAVCLPMSQADAVGPLRLAAGVQVCQTQEQFWLQGEPLDEALELRLRSLPGAQRFFVLPDGQLRRPGARVPQGRLPSGAWLPLSQWLHVELPPTVWGGQLEQRAALALVRSTQEVEPGVLITTIERWNAYIALAPQVRFDRWHFAIARDGRTVVRGQPLPPLPGDRWVERQGVAIPCGWSLPDGIDATVMQRLLTLDSGDLALVAPDGSWEMISSGDFVRATRSAVRLSAEAFVHG
jgi:MoxR-vWA-beta-propeller ternary system domain bpX2